MQDCFVESLSHGMQQRVGIARTLLHNPEVLILDEPANGLDPEARIEMRTILLRLAAEGRTLIVTSHILPELARICQQVAIITHGTLRAFGTVEEIGRLVSQQRTIEAHLVSDKHVGLAAEVIRKSIEPDAEIVEAHSEATVRFRSALSEEFLARVLRRLFKAGILVSQYREVQTDLEEAFMSFTGTQPTANQADLTDLDSTESDSTQRKSTGAKSHV